MKLAPSILLLLFLIGLGAGRGAHASDLDDGISKHLDDSIEQNDELGQKERNVSFIKMNALSKSDVASKSSSQSGISGTQAGSAPGSGNLNSVVLGPGGSVRGDIIILDQSRGDKTQVIGR